MAKLQPQATYPSGLIQPVEGVQMISLKPIHFYLPLIHVSLLK